MTVPQWGKFPLELDEVQSGQQRDHEMHPYLDTEAIPYARSNAHDYVCKRPTWTDASAKPITWETPAGRGAVSRCHRTRTSTRQRSRRG